MAGEAAITKIKTRLKAWLDGEVSNLDIEVDRPFDRSVRGKLVNIRAESVQILRQAHGMGDLHDATFMFDVMEQNAPSQTVTEAQAEAHADIVARLGARTAAVGTIGELIEECIPLAVAGQPDEFNLADHGVATLAVRITWRCPEDDFRTIAGQNGLVP